MRVYFSLTEFQVKSPTASLQASGLSLLYSIWEKFLQRWWLGYERLKTVNIRIFQTSPKPSFYRLFGGVKQANACFKEENTWTWKQVSQPEPINCYRYYNFLCFYLSLLKSYTYEEAKKLLEILLFVSFSIIRSFKLTLFSHSVTT